MALLGLEVAGRVRDIVKLIETNGLTSVTLPSPKIGIMTVSKLDGDDTINIDHIEAIVTYNGNVYLRHEDETCMWMGKLADDGFSEAQTQISPATFAASLVGSMPDGVLKRILQDIAHPYKMIKCVELHKRTYVIGVIEDPHEKTSDLLAAMNKGNFSKVIVDTKSIGLDVIIIDAKDDAHRLDEVTLHTDGRIADGDTELSVCFGDSSTHELPDHVFPWGHIYNGVNCTLDEMISAARYLQSSDTKAI